MEKGFILTGTHRSSCQNKIQISVKLDLPAAAHLLEIKMQDSYGTFYHSSSFFSFYH